MGTAGRPASLQRSADSKYGRRKPILNPVRLGRHRFRDNAASANHPLEDREEGEHDAESKQTARSSSRWPRGRARCALAASALARGSRPGRTREAASHREAPLISLDPAGGHLGLLHVPQLRGRERGQCRPDHGRDPGRGAQLGAELLQLRPERPLLVPHRQRSRTAAPTTSASTSTSDTRFAGVRRALGLPLTHVAGPRPITALDWPGSDGLGSAQTYSVSMIRGFQADRHSKIARQGPRSRFRRTSGRARCRTTTRSPPQGIHEPAGNGVRVFAGQRDDPFYIDLGGLFDTLNFGLSPLLHRDDRPGCERRSERLRRRHALRLQHPDDRSRDPGVVPDLRRPGRRYHADLEARGRGRHLPAAVHVQGPGTGGQIQQVERLANPLVNEAIIGTPDKDDWNAIDNQGGVYGNQENKYLDYYLNPRLALALQLVFGVPAATTGRTDLRDLLLTYDGKAPYGSYSDLLRLDVRTSPTPLASQKRLGPLAHDANGNATPDPAAWPNGRRPIDDVTDVAVRAVGGPNYINALAADGINVNDKPLPNAFPFLASPWDGRNRIHLNRSVTDGREARDRIGGSLRPRRPLPGACRDLRCGGGRMFGRCPLPTSSPASPAAIANRRSGAFRGPRSHPLRAPAVDTAAHRPQAPGRAAPASPTTLPSLTLLGLAYQQRARETGDPSYYSKSRRVAPRRARSRAGSAARDERSRLARPLAPSLPRGARARPHARARLYAGLDPVAQLRHRSATRWSSSAATRRPSRRFDTMARLRPGLSSYARVSYARELTRRPQAARSRAMTARGRRGRRRSRARRVDARPARQALLGRSAGSRRGRARVPARARRPFPATRTRSTRSRGRRPRAATLRRRDRGRARGRSTRFRCRSSSPRSATSTRPAGNAARRAQYALIGAIERLARRERRPDRPRDCAVPASTTGSACAMRSRRARAAAPSGRRSTATTCSPGRSRGTAAAPRRSPTRSARSGSGRRTRSSSSTAG